MGCDPHRSPKERNLTGHNLTGIPVFVQAVGSLPYRVQATSENTLRSDEFVRSIFVVHHDKIRRRSRAKEGYIFVLPAGHVCGGNTITGVHS